MSHLEVLALILAVMGVLYAFYRLVCFLLDLAVPQPARVRPPRAEPVDLHVPYLTSTCETRTRIALARSINEAGPRRSSARPR